MIWQGHILNILARGTPEQITILITAAEFLNISSLDEIPSGWRLATINDVTKFTKLAQKAVTMKWGISTLADGRIHGRGYGYSVDSSVNDSYGGGTCGEKLIFKGVILLIIIHLQCNKMICIKLFINIVCTFVQNRYK